jgi:L-threonine-O-3-phosphate decarboxylase
MDPFEHGGQLRRAAKRYAIRLADWLDLSTGINPWPYPVSPVPLEVWQRLPEDEDEALLDAARAYYGCASILPVAGSQAAIQALPRLRPACRVGILYPTYYEHARAWRRAGHRVCEYDAATLAGALDRLDVVVLVHPNNPTGESFAPAALLEWHTRLAARGGWLVVDEAFMDATPAASLAPFAERDGLIVLRSLGKFFGLAGARLGFVCAAPPLIARLAEELGPWAVSGPARHAAREALADRSWHETMRARLPAAAARLAALLAAHGLAPHGGTALFQWTRTPQAARWHERLARRGILTRLFRDPPALRFGLPGEESAWGRLAEALAALRRPAVSAGAPEEGTAG